LTSGRTVENLEKLSLLKEKILVLQSLCLELCDDANKLEEETITHHKMESEFRQQVENEKAELQQELEKEKKRLYEKSKIVQIEIQTLKEFVC
jgi:hypothetical protein